MAVLDSSGMPIRKVSDDQLIMALNTVARRNQALQMQLMQLGLLVEFLIEKLSATALPDGSPVFSVDETEFEDFSRRRYEEIKVQAKEFQQLMQEQDQANQPQVDLQE
jgi:hypothetical protein